MTNSPRDRRNRKGCFVILAILAFFILLYLFVSVNSKPEDRAASKIHTVPPAPR
jgi:hypothetical protein